MRCTRISRTVVYAMLVATSCLAACSSIRPGFGLPSVATLDIHAIQKQHVEMDIQIECRTEPLNEGSHKKTVVP